MDEYLDSLFNTDELSAGPRHDAPSPSPPSPSPLTHLPRLLLASRASSRCSSVGGAADLNDFQGLPTEARLRWAYMKLNLRRAVEITSKTHLDIPENASTAHVSPARRKSPERSPNREDAMAGHSTIDPIVEDAEAEATKDEEEEGAKKDEDGDVEANKESSLFEIFLKPTKLVKVKTGSNRAAKPRPRISLPIPVVDPHTAYRGGGASFRQNAGNPQGTGNVSASAPAQPTSWRHDSLRNSATPPSTPVFTPTPLPAASTASLSTSPSGCPWKWTNADLAAGAAEEEIGGDSGGDRVDGAEAGMQSFADVVNAAVIRERKKSLGKASTDLSRDTLSSLCSSRVRTVAVANAGFFVVWQAPDWLTLSFGFVFLPVHVDSPRFTP